MDKTDKRTTYAPPAYQEGDARMHPLLVAAVAAFFFSIFVYGCGPRDTPGSAEVAQAQAP